MAENSRLTVSQLRSAIAGYQDDAPVYFLTEPTPDTPDYVTPELFLQHTEQILVNNKHPRVGLYLTKGNNGK